MGATIDTRRAHAVRQFGDITQIFTWVNGERAVVLLPTFRPGAPWFVICDSAAWQYDEPRYLAKQSAKAAEVLDMPESVVKIATLMHDGLDELVTMPSEPPTELSRASFGQLVAKADGKVIGGEEIRVPVQRGASYG